MQRQTKVDQGILINGIKQSAYIVISSFNVSNFFIRFIFLFMNIILFADNAVFVLAVALIICTLNLSKQHSSLSKKRGERVVVNDQKN